MRVIVVKLNGQKLYSSQIINVVLCVKIRRQIVRFFILLRGTSNLACSDILEHVIIMRMVLKERFEVSKKNE